MGRILLNDEDIFITKAPLGSVVVADAGISAVASDYKRVRANVLLEFPEPEMVRNTEMIGAGEQGGPRRLYRWGSKTVTISGALNTDLAAILWARFLGGTIVDSAVTASVSYGHAIALQTKAQGTFPKLSNLIIRHSTNVGFVFCNMGVNSFSIDHNGTDEPTYTAELVGTGYWAFVSDITGLNTALGSVSAAATASYDNMHGAAISFTYNDGSLKNPVTDVRLLASGFSGTNNLTVKEMPGNPFYKGDRRKGSFATEISRGVRQISVTGRLYLDDTGFPELSALSANLAITNATLVYGGYKIGASSDFHEFECKLAKANIGALTPATEDDKAAFNITFEAEDDSATLSPAVSGRVQNEQATLA